MKLFHGTNTPFDIIDLSKSRPNKDFGRGFYLAPSFQQAFELASARVTLVGGTPIVQTYEFDERLLTSGQLKVLKFEEYSEDWAKFILANRNNTSDAPVHDYDVVTGPIANDRVGAQLWKYTHQIISLPTLIKNLKYMKGITFQYYFGTEKAIKNLHLL